MKLLMIEVIQTMKETIYSCMNEDCIMHGCDWVDKRKKKCHICETKLDKLELDE